jgi:hypothetical protein
VIPNQGDKFMPAFSGSFSGNVKVQTAITGSSDLLDSTGWQLCNPQLHVANLLIAQTQSLDSRARWHSPDLFELLL